MHSFVSFVYIITSGEDYRRVLVSDGRIDNIWSGPFFLLSLSNVWFQAEINEEYHKSLIYFLIRGLFLDVRSHVSDGFCDIWSPWSFGSNQQKDLKTVSGPSSTFWIHYHWPHLRPCSSTCLCPTAAATTVFLIKWCTTMTNRSDAFAIADPCITTWVNGGRDERSTPVYLFLPVRLRQSHLSQHLRPLLHHQGPFVGVRADVTVVLRGSNDIDELSHTVKIIGFTVWRKALDSHNWN